MNLHATFVTNVLIIGCGGAGLRAAIEVSKNNLSVKVLEKDLKMTHIQFSLQVV